MHWNYRVVAHDDGSYAIHEVYYDDDCTPHSVTANPVGFVGDDCNQLRKCLECALGAFEHPPLRYSEFDVTTRTAKT